MTESLDLDALEAVARAATQERWYRVKALPANHVVKAEVFPSEYVGESRPSLRVEVEGPNWTRDTEHIATFDPSTVLALIGRVREAEAAIERVRELHVEEPETGKCRECSAALYSIHSVRWPCPTARALGGDQS